MKLSLLKKEFEENKVIYESALLTFTGVEGFDVYNCSVPFKINGVTYIYGRVEKSGEWATSHVCLFRETGPDKFDKAEEFEPLALEDPYIQKIGEEMILGGTHVQKVAGKVSNFFGYFYRGTPTSVKYFTTGPNKMKDIRIVPLKNGETGVFSRHRTGSEAKIGFARIKDISELTPELIHSAPVIDGILENGQWGGINQAYLLESGKIGCIGHISYGEQVDAELRLSVYVNVSFVFDPDTHGIDGFKIIGTKSCYPDFPPKVPKLADCVFASGIVLREDGFADLYSGVGDRAQGRIKIEYPFKGEGSIQNINF